MTVEEVKEHWRCIVRLGEAVVALGGAREAVELAHGSATAGSSIDVLEKAAHGLLIEAGQALAALRDADDPEVQTFVRLLLARLHAPGPRPNAAAVAREETRVPDE